MRRIFFVLTVAALMAAMMLTAGPAQANVSIGGGGSISNGTNVVQNGGAILGFGTGIDFDDNGIDFGHNCCGHNFGHRGISFGGIEQDSRSGELETDFSVS